jgi:hypothetical protein
MPSPTFNDNYEKNYDPREIKNPLSKKEIEARVSSQHFGDTNEIAPQVSVIVVRHYQEPDFWDRLWRSVKDQTIAPSSGDRRVIEWELVHVMNYDNGFGSLGAAFNAGVKAAIGDYIHFLGDDDWLEPFALDWLVKEVEQRQVATPSVKALVTKANLHDAKGNLMVKDGAPGPLFIDRDWFWSVGGYRQVNLYEDHSWVKESRKKHPASVETAVQPTYNVRIWKSSTRHPHGQTTSFMRESSNLYSMMRDHGFNDVVQ